MTEAPRIIREARKEAGLTQAQLAGLLKTGQSTVARLERDTYSGHTLPTLLRIARVLNKKLTINLVPNKRPQALRADTRAE